MAGAGAVKYIDRKQYESIGIFSPYNFNGIWITIPDFDKGINDADSALTRIYYRLNGWDGQWYYHIEANGYQCDSIPESNNPHACNIAFFPLVPVLGSMLGLTGMDLVYALPLVSQLFYLSSILLLLFFIRSIGEMRPIHLVPVLLFMAYPGSLYYFTPYSESSLSFLIIALFTLSYWQLRQPTIGKWCLLAITLHDSPMGQKYGRASGDMRATRDLSDRLVKLPLWLGIESELERIIEQVVGAVDQVTSAS